MLVIARTSTVAAVWLVLSTATARAQEVEQPLDAPTPIEAALAQARGEFAAGNEAWSSEHWEDAYGHYARAYELVPRANMLVNLAGSELRTGRLVAAGRHYREFLRSAEPEMLARYRADAERALGELESRVPTARLVVRGLESGDALQLDDAAIARAVSATDVAVDPGSHVLAAVRDGEVVAMTRFSAAEGEMVPVELVVPARPRPAPEIVVRTAPAEHRTVVQSPWFWITIVAVLAAGGIALGVVLGTNQQDEPFVGNLGRIEL
jgi:hypothetical protein